MRVKQRERERVWNWIIFYRNILCIMQYAYSGIIIIYVAVYWLYACSRQYSDFSLFENMAVLSKIWQWVRVRCAFGWRRAARYHNALAHKRRPSSSSSPPWDQVKGELNFVKLSSLMTVQCLRACAASPIYGGSVYVQTTNTHTHWYTHAIQIISTLISALGR